MALVTRPIDDGALSRCAAELYASRSIVARSAVLSAYRPVALFHRSPEGLRHWGWRFVVRASRRLELVDLAQEADGGFRIVRRHSRDSMRYFLSKMRVVAASEFAAEAVEYRLDLVMDGLWRFPLVRLGSEGQMLLFRFVDGVPERVEPEGFPALPQGRPRRPDADAP